jgi:hypothetical protein
MNKKQIDKLCPGIEPCPEGHYTQWQHMTLTCKPHIIFSDKKKSTRLWEGTKNLPRTQIGQYHEN